MGYSWNGIQKISYENALLRWLGGKHVMLLYDDNTEAYAEASEDIVTHSHNGGEFGYEKGGGKHELCNQKRQKAQR